MLAIRLPAEVETRLEALAQATGRTKTFYAREAILEHLDDLEDLYLAEQRLIDIRAGKTQTVPLEEVLGRMDTTQVTLIHKILAAADERNLPLWIGGGWAIDARLGRVTRKHDDIDLTFPGERRGELEAIVEMLGGRVMEELDYGFLAEIGDELLDCEPAWWADEAYEIAEAPQGSCPEAAEGVIAGRPVRCNSWEAIIWDYFYYADEVPPVDWPTKHIESYRLACTSLGAEKVEVLRAAFRSRYAA